MHIYLRLCRNQAIRLRILVDSTVKCVKMSVITAGEAWRCEFCLFDKANQYDHEYADD